MARRYFETVAAGDELGPLVKRPTRMRLAMFAGATWEFARIHYDAQHAATAEGLPGPIVQGPLQGNYLAQLVLDWAGPGGSLKRLAWRHHAIALVDEELICRGRVADKQRVDGRGQVECEVWAENRRGERILTGRVVVVLPRRDAEADR